MSLEITARRVCSSRMPTAQAFVAMTTRSAVSTPSGVCRTAGARRSRRVTRVCSWMRTPSSSATRRRPRTSSAGWTIAAEGSNMPAMWRSDPLRRGGLLGRPLLERHHAELAADRHRAVPRAQLRLGRRRPEVAAAVEVRVDAVLAAERADLVHRARRPRARSRARRRGRTARRACRAWPTTTARSRRCGRSRRRRRCPARARRHRTTARAA